MSGCYYNDSDPFVCEWLRNLIAAGLIPAGDVDERPIEQIQAADVAGYTQCHFFAGIGGWAYALQLAGWGGRPVWTGSCPCQPVSVAGQRKGHADRRHVWPSFHRLISEQRPSVVFGEQVARKDGREWLAAVRADLEASGYAVGAGDLCASAFGIPQARHRLFFVADTPSTDDAGIASTVRWFGSLREVGPYREYADWRQSCEVGVLDDGIPPRLAKRLVGGFGNAIVPQAAAAFVSAYMDARGFAEAVA